MQSNSLRNNQEITLLQLARTYAARCRYGMLFHILCGIRM